MSIHNGGVAYKPSDVVIDASALILLLGLNEPKACGVDV